MTEALLITATGARIIQVELPPPPEWRIARPHWVVRQFRPTLDVPGPIRVDRVCRRITRMWEYPPVYEEEA